MSDPKVALLKWFLLSWGVCGVESVASGQRLENQFCPVMQENRVEARWSTVYRGQRVLFCCNNCLDSFRKSPRAYLGSLPQFADDPSVPSGRTHVNEKSASVASNTLGTLPNDWDTIESASPRNVVLFVLLVGTLLFGCWRLLTCLLRKRVPDAMTIRPAFAEIVVFFLLASVLQLTWGKRRLEGDVIKSQVLRTVHHATYFDHGYPPVPPRPNAPKRLAATFYRGNDERSEFLFNGGNYLTAQFDIAIQRQNGTVVGHGDEVVGEPLLISFTIRRAPNSPDRLFAPSMMNRIYLTKEYGPLMGWKSPIEDRVPIQDFGEKPGEWRARYPLGVIVRSAVSRIDPRTVTREQLMQFEGVTQEDATWFIAYRDAGYPIRGRHDLEQAGIEGLAQTAIASTLGEVDCNGIIYVCEANYVEKGQMGARFHYGLQYELRVRDGRITKDSDLWMGCLSRSQKAAKGAIPDDQWLSLEPLPIVSAPQDVSDQLFGIDDYPGL